MVGLGLLGDAPRLRLLATAALLLAGCQGGGGDGDTEGGSATTGVGMTEGTGVDTAAETEGETGVPEGCEGQAYFDPGETPLRRLTHTQYNNTVNDLFPGVTIPTQAILVDPKSGGFENFGELQTPSSLLIGQYQQAAVGVTAAAMAEADAFLPCATDGGADPEGCGHAFLTDFATRAFRRPLSPEESAAYLGFFDQQLAGEGFGVALQLTMQAILQSPPFIYFLEYDGTPAPGSEELELIDGYAMASRLSYFLWDSMPDPALLVAAESGDLATAEGVEAAARRLLAEAPARGAVVNFHRQWLDLDKIDTITLDPATYPGFDEGLRDDMREEIRRLVERVIFDGEGTLAELLTTSETVGSAGIAALYGAPAPVEPWGTIALDPAQRAGLLTTPGWLASRAHAVHPSPVQRGVFVLERLLCQPPPVPPADVDITPPEEGGDSPVTNRERYDEHASNPKCQGCHQTIDGIGFGFEHYDSEGRWRDQDGGQPVDASGILLGSDVDGPFADAIDLAGRLGESETVQRCVVTQWYRYALGRATNLDDACARDALDLAFEAAEGDIQELLVNIAVSDGFRYRRAQEQG